MVRSLCNILPLESTRVAAVVLAVAVCSSFAAAATSETDMAGLLCLQVAFGGNTSDAVRRLNWTTLADPCSCNNATNGSDAQTHALCWQGVECSSQHQSPVVTGISLAYRGLASDFALTNSCWKYLSSLRLLNLSGNALSGMLPPLLPPTLQTIDLSHNGGISGMIPLSYGLMTSLVWLDVSWNEIAHPLDDGNVSSCFPPSLVMLDLSANVMTNNPGPASWKALWNLTQLTYLGLAYNPWQWSHLTPEVFCNTFTQLQTLHLEYSQLAGTFPSCLANHPSLLTFTMFNNNVQGPLPLLTASRLTLFNVANNQLTGDLTVTGLPPNISIFVAEANSLSASTFPLSQWFAPNLEVFMMNNNPLGITDLSPLCDVTHRLISLNIRNCEIRATLPACIATAFPPLAVLKISGNQLYGDFPSDWRNATLLGNVDCSLNNLTGNVSTWRFPPSLTVFWCATNDFYGAMPDEWDHISNLNLAVNRISGSIPATLRVFCIFLTLNQLTGTLPANLTIQPNVCVNVQVNNNQLTGSVPNAYLNCTLLDVSFNKLSGPLPVPEAPEQSSLQVLSFAGNAFNETVPVSYALFPNLVLANFARNQLSGQVPCWNTNTLKSVCFASNRFSGEFAGCGSAVLLDVSKNDLSGTFYVPPSAVYLSIGQNTGITSLSFPMAVLSNLSYIDISYTGLTQFPFELLQNNLSRGFVAQGTSISANLSVFSNRPMLSIVDVSQSHFYGELRLSRPNDYLVQYINIRSMSPDVATLNKSKICAASNPHCVMLLSGYEAANTTFDPLEHPLYGYLADFGSLWSSGLEPAFQTEVSLSSDGTFDPPVGIIFADSAIGIRNTLLSDRFLVRCKLMWLVMAGENTTIAGQQLDLPPSWNNTWVSVTSIPNGVFYPSLNGLTPRFEVMYSLAAEVTIDDTAPQYRHDVYNPLGSAKEFTIKFESLTPQGCGTPGSFGVPLTRWCVECPPMADCNGSKLSTSECVWRNSPNVLPFYECDEGSTACCGVGRSGSECEEGYNGPLCALCDSGYAASSNTQCTRCLPTAVSITLIILVPLLAFIGISLVVHVAVNASERSVGSSWKTKAALFVLPAKLILNHFSLIGLVAIATKATLASNHKALSLSNSFGNVGLDSSLVLFPLRCLLFGDGSYGKSATTEFTLMVSFVPVAMVLCVVIFYLQKRERSILEVFLTVLVCVTLLTFNVLAQVATQMFRCDTFQFTDVQHYFYQKTPSLLNYSDIQNFPLISEKYTLLHIDRHVDCTSDEYRTYTAAASAVLVMLFVLLGVIAVAYIKIHRERPFVGESMFYFLTRNYKEGFWFWDMIIAARKALGCIIVFLPMDHSFRVSLFTTYVALFLALHLWFLPHRFSENNLLDTGSYITTLILSLVTSDEDGSIKYVVFVALIMTISTLFVAGCAVSHVRQTWNSLQRFRSESVINETTEYNADNDAEEVNYVWSLVDIEDTRLQAGMANLHRGDDTAEAVVISRARLGSASGAKNFGTLSISYTDVELSSNHLLRKPSTKGQSLTPSGGSASTLASTASEPFISDTSLEK